MIKYALKCENNHGFEAWFGDSQGYEEQNKKGLIECPYCASIQIEKAIMAPNIRTSKNENAIAPIINQPELLPAEIAKAFSQIKTHIEQNYDYVGKDFADEARAIHAGTAEERLIYGETSPKEVVELIEEGVPIAPIPPLANPKADKKLN